MADDNYTQIKIQEVSRFVEELNATVRQQTMQIDSLTRRLDRTEQDNDVKQIKEKFFENIQKAQEGVIEKLRKDVYTISRQYFDDIGDEFKKKVDEYVSAIQLVSRRQIKNEDSIQTQKNILNKYTAILSYLADLLIIKGIITKVEKENIADRAIIRAKQAER